MPLSWQGPVFAALWAVSAILLAAGAIRRRSRGAAPDPFASPAAAGAGLALAITVVAVDMWLYPALYSTSLLLADAARATLGAIAVTILAALAGWRRDAVGLRLRPRQGWWWWIRLALALGVVGLVLAIVFVALFPPEFPYQPGDPLHRIYMVGLSAPLFEETIHRLAFCTAAVAGAGRWPTIAASGLLFGALHIAYGNPDPSNMVGGFILAWAFLESGSILVPVALHSLGNLGLLVFNLVVAALST